jgi:hypothetical protein
MRLLRACLLVVAACSSTATPAVNSPAAEARSAQNDSALFPASWPSLRAVENASEPARVDQLAREARSQLDEEWGLLATKDAAHKAAYKRLSLRIRILHDNALIGIGHSFDALADFVKQPFDCAKVPQRSRDTCDSLMAALATAFPNVIPGPGKIEQVDHSLVVGDETSESQLATFLTKASGFQGSVVQRMRLTSAARGVLKIGTALQLRVSSKQTLGGGDVVWVAFEPRNIKHVGKTWDLQDAHVLFVEPKPE